MTTTRVDPDYADAPTGMPYQQYSEEDDAHLRGLEVHIAEVLREHTRPGDDFDQIAAALTAHLFKRVKVHSWCGVADCHKAWCTPTHYRFELTTHARAYGPASEET